MFDKNKFAQILKNISDTYDNQRTFADKTGVNRTYLSQYINLKLDEPPSPKILKKIAYTSNGVTSYYELMKTCGYLSSIDINELLESEDFSDIIENNIEHNGHLLLTMNFDTDDFSEQEKAILNKYIDLWNKNENIDINNLIAGLYDNSKEKILREYKKFHKKLNELVEKNKITNKNKKNENAPSIVLVYGTIPAGIPMECIEDIIDKEEISADMLKGGKQYFGLKVKGNSMFPEYLDGDILILEKVEDCENGQDCCVMVNGNDATFKRIFKNENGIILQPLNPEYQPMIYTNEQIEQLPIRIIGRVVELRRKK